ncbi:MAG TPA: hypothetical protein VIQ60_05305 [Gemmatimonadaceae bacterium]
MSRVATVDFAAATIFAVFRATFFPRAAFCPPADFGLGETSALERAFRSSPRLRAEAPLAFTSGEAAERLPGRLLMRPPAA